MAYRIRVTSDEGDIHTVKDREGHKYAIISLTQGGKTADAILKGLKLSSGVQCRHSMAQEAIKNAAFARL